MFPDFKVIYYPNTNVKKMLLSKLHTYAFRNLTELDLYYSPIAISNRSVNSISLAHIPKYKSHQLKQCTQVDGKYSVSLDTTLLGLNCRQ